MSYWIMVFTQKPLGAFSEKDLLAAVTASNFHTLCDQYGLDPALIQPSLAYLAFDLSINGQQPLLVLRYQPKHQPPIVVTEWDAMADGGLSLLEDVTEGLAIPVVLRNLEETRFIYSVELVESQLGDLGLLFAYELARWIAGRGSGLVLGLDRTWYRLNPFQAFIPLSDRNY